MSSYHQLTISERELIFLYHELSFSIRRIAQLIKRAQSTMSRELRRHTTTVGYRPSSAQNVIIKTKLVVVGTIAWLTLKPSDSWSPFS